MANLDINGKTISVDVEDDTPLLWAIRENVGLTGTKYGCGIAQCGACTVHLDGMPRRSCVTPISMVDGSEVVTIEGVDGPEAEAVKTAWAAIDVPQCGYCQSGQIMSAIALLQMVPKPSDTDIDGAMTGNICRCATYHRIRAAIHAASNSMEG